MKTCPDCGSRVYNLGCTWCNEEAYIAEQVEFDKDYGVHYQHGDEPDRLAPAHDGKQESQS